MEEGRRCITNSLRKADIHERAAKPAAAGTAQTSGIVPGVMGGVFTSELLSFRELRGLFHTLWNMCVPIGCTMIDFCLVPSQHLHTSQHAR